MERTATVERKTRETDIRLTLKLDGKGDSSINTGVPFMDHMLQLLAAHGFFDLDIRARGDTEVDDHHTVEDLGICLGSALGQALKNKGGIRRYGVALVPMDDALSRVVIDISNRPFLAYRVETGARQAGTFDVGLIREFARGITTHAGITAHIDLLRGNDAHHIAESVFKALGRALDEATRADDRLKGTPLSTKGTL
ncbi:MAG: imidazoleglycerol-phosphate dehydratase HisB [Deltaproteobacteria bacterium]|nr:imidazoleglycerol-phosphate dehydratase HisB [Deltaproteobacteria bacterium]